jgi:integrase
MLVKVVDAHDWTKKTYNNAVSALRRAFAFGFEDHPEQHNPAKALRSARMSKKDRPAIDPFSIQDAEALIVTIHREWGEARGNYDEFRFFTGFGLRRRARSWCPISIRPYVGTRLTFSAAQGTRVRCTPLIR